MSSKLPGADVRGFYLALGIELAGWAKREAPAGRLPDPDAHAHGDRDPSCSVKRRDRCMALLGGVARRVARMTRRWRVAETRARRSI